jgi:NSS family neurotransmitter:Na+ symporter
MPIVALLTCIFVGYILKPKSLIEEAEVMGEKFKEKTLFTVIVKYVAPVCLVIILVFAILEGVGIIKV